MLKYSLIITLLFNSWLVVGQEHQEAQLLDADSTWGVEFFEFPLHFAPKLEYKGTEEAYFPSGWATVDSPEFWTYAFVWRVNMNRDISTYDLKEHIETYFDGLMYVKNNRQRNNIPGTKAKFKEQERTRGVTYFTGEVDIIDMFVTKSMLSLHVKVETSFCPKLQQAVVFFRFSPKTLDHDVWQKLDKLSLQDDICNP